MSPNPLQPVHSLFEDLVGDNDINRTHPIRHSSPTEIDNISHTHSEKLDIKLNTNTNSTMNVDMDMKIKETEDCDCDMNNHHNNNHNVIHDGDNSNGQSNEKNVNGSDNMNGNENHGLNTAVDDCSDPAVAAIIDAHVIRCINISRINHDAIQVDHDSNIHYPSYSPSLRPAPEDASSCSSSSSSVAPPCTVSKSPNKGLEVDNMISKELLELSFYDRNAINEEMHGVRCLAPNETPELLTLAIAGLKQELDAIAYKPAYDKAQIYAQMPQFSRTSYVNTNEFRLKFLRCELFDIRMAAVRLIKYLDLMVELYGLFALQRKVTLKDFSKHEMQILRAGYFQMFPFRDRSGRRVMCIVGEMGIKFDPTLRLKSYFYFWMSASEDIESQQKGVIFLVWPGTDGMRQIPNQTDRTLHDKCNAASPIRIAAVHFCLPNTPFFHLLRSIMARTLGKTYRLRLKFHVGEGVEMQYVLKSYGIPVDLTPLTDSGNIKTTYLKQWLRLRKIIELGMTPNGFKTNNVSIIECPRSNDVIFRPGTSMLCHPGNVVFRGMIEAKQNRITVKRAEKEEVALEIIQEVQQTGGRFLMWDNGGWWSELNDVPLISGKISISYRDFKTKVKTLVQQEMQKKRRNQQTVQNTDCSTSVFVEEDIKKRRRGSTILGCGDDMEWTNESSPTHDR
uniref:DUF6824 domain-containing protein n=1 Tax=Pseudo-nitzschia australis TaxID=44445 RepID=A0A7S4AGI2_9STRA